MLKRTPLNFSITCELVSWYGLHCARYPDNVYYVSGFAVNDDSDESVEPRRKKTRRLWQDSDSEESDSTWGLKKRR